MRQIGDVVTIRHGLDLQADTRLGRQYIMVTMMVNMAGQQGTINGISRDNHGAPVYHVHNFLWYEDWFDSATEMFVANVFSESVEPPPFRKIKIGRERLLQIMKAIEIDVFRSGDFLDSDGNALTDLSDTALDENLELALQGDQTAFLAPTLLKFFTI